MRNERDEKAETDLFRRENELARATETVPVFYDCR